MFVLFIVLLQADKYACKSDVTTLFFYNDYSNYPTRVGTGDF